MRRVALLVALAGLGCGESAPTAAPCTRADELSPCSQGSTATRIPNEVEAWNVVVRVTLEEQVEYLDGGVQCALMRQTCVAEECIYARTQDLPPPDGWFIIIENSPYYWGFGEDTEEAAIAACVDYHDLE